MSKHILNIGNRILLFLLPILFITSCVAPKQVPYFQDLQEDSVNRVNVVSPSIMRVKPQDKIYILVSGVDSRLTAPYNIQLSTGGGGNSTMLNRLNIGYTIDEAGNIDFPGLGKVYIEGLTREEIANKIKNALIEKQYVKDPVVFVEFMNLTFTVLGDISSPGTYDIIDDRITLLQAISMAGDLNISGKRKNVLVLRQENNKQVSYRVDLCSAEQLFSSPVYYLRQNDVIYVEPSKMRANQSSVNANNFQSVSFWMSAVSFITAMMAIFTK